MALEGGGRFSAGLPSAATGNIVSDQRRVCCRKLTLTYGTGLFQRPRKHLLKTINRFWLLIAASYSISMLSLAITHFLAGW